MYVIENEQHEQQGKVLNNLRSVHRPDGGWTTNGKVDEQLYDESGNVYFIREVIHTVEGEGPRVVSNAAPAWDGEKWTKVKTVGAALHPPQDPVPGDENYRYEELRKRDYDKNIPLGDQADAILKWAVAIRMKQSAVADAVDGLTIEQLPAIATPAAVEGNPDVVTPGAIQLTADSLNDLKSALDPVFDLPSDLDGVIGQWTSVKAKFPKPEE